MIKKTFFTAMMAIGLTTASAQSLKVSGAYEGAVPEGMHFQLFPAEGTAQRPDTISFIAGKLKAAAAPSTYNIYKLVGASRKQQIIIPIFLKSNNDGQSKLSIKFGADGEVDILSPDADTRALVAFNRLYAQRAKAMWMEGKDMEAGRLKALVVGFPAIADSIIGAEKPTDTTSQYLRLWAATLTFDNIESIKFATGRDAASLGIDRDDVINSLASTVDCPMATAFEASARIALAAIGNGNLEENLSALTRKFSDASLIARAEDVLVGRYISSFDYANRYEEGLAELTSLTDRFSLDAKYLQEFKVRKSSIPGTPFPDGVVLTDKDGRTVDFSSFRGKYVFIDMWASWCVPCIKEIPHLRQLEKELGDGNVAFVSISIDSNENAWKKKMTDLGLTGHQLICKNNKLGEALNVRGIPFFLIYDTQGNLYRYNAPRPSDPSLKPLLQQLK